MRNLGLGISDYGKRIMNKGFGIRDKEKEITI